jgi:L-2-hydroxyglutarate oxidase LhgO
MQDILATNQRVVGSIPVSRTIFLTLRMTLQAQVVIVGAGVVGLACARAFARAGREVIVIEKNKAFGQETSSRNSEVIHAGIYYPAGSLKAKFCVQGRQQLYGFCREFGVAFNPCGKLIVATSADQVQDLEKIKARALANGVDDLVWLSATQAKAMEPQLQCIAALLSPSTGIVDSHGLMLALLGDAERHGANLALNSAVQHVQATSNGLLLSVVCEGHEEQLLAQTVVNAAGHQAIALAGSCQAISTDKLPTAYLAKGNYFSLAGRSPFSRLIYPVPEPGGLGVHLTLDLGMQARFGPDVEWVETEDYVVNPKRADVFYGAIRRYWPALQDNALMPAYAGIRPKIVPRQGPDADFLLQTEQQHGVPGLVNLFGIESPGLTASLAIAQAVVHAASHHA